MRCGLIGEKLGHSHSKTLHGLLADYRYDLIELAPEALGPFLQLSLIHISEPTRH